MVLQTAFKMIRNWLAEGVIVVTCVSLLYFGYRGYREMKHAGLESCVLSLETVISKRFDSDPRLLGSVSSDGQWRQLSDTETYEFFNSDSKITSLDCAGFPNFYNGKNESGDDLHISVRHVNGMVDVSIDGLDAH